MTAQAGESGQAGRALESARAALAARDADLAAADRALTAVVASAHRAAVMSIDRIEAISTDIDAAVSGRRLDGPAAAHELSRFLLDRQRAIGAVLYEAMAVAQSKTLVLQELTDRYRLTDVC